jgi:DNA replication protein DnaC
MRNAYLNCACPCGCRRLTKHPTTTSPVLIRRARCTTCSTADHRTTNPTPHDPAETARPLTIPVPLDPDDIELDRQIAEQQRKDIHTEAWARWQASLPEKFRHAHTDNPKILERLRRWEDGHPGTAGAVVLGGVGEGKTFLAVGYANAAIQHGLVKPGDVLYGTEAELLSSAANSAFSEVDKALRRLINPHYRMIVIDDVGRGTWIRDDMRPKVFSLVLDAAWRDNRVIVITTNLIPDDLLTYIGEGAMDRLRSMVGYDAVDLTDRDMRRKTTQQALQQAADNRR